MLEKTFLDFHQKFANLFVNKTVDLVSDGFLSSLGEADSFVSVPRQLKHTVPYIP